VSDTYEDELEQSHAETRAAFETRGFMYAYLYEELADELGPERAQELMKRAIYRRGLEIGRKYRSAAHAGDLAEVGAIFCDGSPCGGELFNPGIEQEGDDHIVLSMTSCPLVDAWKEAGLDPEEIDVMCSISAPSTRARSKARDSTWSSWTGSAVPARRSASCCSAHAASADAERKRYLTM